MPFIGFLGPTWKSIVLTRILHRQDVYYHSILEYTSIILFYVYFSTLFYKFAVNIFRYAYRLIFYIPYSKIHKHTIVSKIFLICRAKTSIEIKKAVTQQHSMGHKNNHCRWFSLCKKAGVVRCDSRRGG